MRLDCKSDMLMDYFDMLENRVSYKKWFFDLAVDDKHKLLHYSFDSV